MLNNIANSEALNKTAFFLRTDQKCVEITSRFYVCSQKIAALHCWLEFHQNFEIWKLCMYSRRVSHNNAY